MDCRSPLFQAVRIIDVVILGPVMVRVGSKIRGPVGLFLATAGVATIVFNGLTFFQIESRQNG